MGITSDSTRDFCDRKVLYIHGDRKIYTCQNCIEHMQMRTFKNGKI